MTIKLRGSTDGSVSLTAPADTSPTGTDITLTLPTDAGSANQFLKNSGTAGTLDYSSMVENSSGHVSIGTTTSFRTFQVGNSGAETIEIEPGEASNKNLTLHYNRSSDAFITSEVRAADHTFFIGSSEKARIDSSGRLLVGTTTEGAANADNFTIADSGHCGITIRSGTSSNGSIYFSDATSGAAEYDGYIEYEQGDRELNFGTAQTKNMTIDSVGRLISLPTYNATSGTAANVGISSSGKFFRSTSSIRYKTDVETMEDSYADAILNCRPVWYRSTSPEDPAEYSYWGFIAEEVSQIDERLVTWGEDEDGNLREEGVQYDRFVPHLLNLIKRQQQAIETLEAKVAALEAG